jgi:hypothetical protein
MSDTLPRAYRYQTRAIIIISPDSRTNYLSPDYQAVGTLTSKRNLIRGFLDPDSSPAVFPSQAQSLPTFRNCISYPEEFNFFFLFMLSEGESICLFFLLYLSSVAQRAWL